MRMQVAIVLIYTALQSACAADVVQLCLNDEAQGQYLFEKQNACGCQQQACAEGTLCYHHICWPREFCQQGVCCDPALQQDCQCNPQLHLSDTANCGCQGPCPAGAHCTDGACVCNASQFVTCDPSAELPWGECKRPASCLCVPSEHVSDNNNCGCRGSCAAGQQCLAGVCKCNPLAHMEDNTNCGCAGACDVANGQECSSGQCRCDPLRHQTDNTNCGCRGACDPSGGRECQGGQCRCDPLKHQSDNSNCGCLGACDASGGKECLGGQCRCDSLKHMDDNSNCACAGPCGVRDACFNGVCKCDPERHLSDDSNCYCNGPCKDKKTCKEGSCG